MRNYYISDTHFAHENIIKYCNRPFASVELMNEVMFHNVLDVVRAGHRLIHAGDLCFGRGDTQWLLAQAELPGREQHVLVTGNHDRGLKGGRTRAAYERWFGTIVGRYQTWKSHSYIIADTLFGKRVRVMVSHLPQRELLGCAVNLYGHVHNNTLVEEAWAGASSQHFNICVEVQDYQPRTLEEIVEAAHASVYRGHSRGVSLSK